MRSVVRPASMHVHSLSPQKRHRNVPSVMFRKNLLIVMKLKLYYNTYEREYRGLGNELTPVGDKHRCSATLTFWEAVKGHSLYSLLLNEQLLFFAPLE